MGEDVSAYAGGQGHRPTVRAGWAGSRCPRGPDTVPHVLSLPVVRGTRPPVCFAPHLLFPHCLPKGLWSLQLLPGT